MPTKVDSLHLSKEPYLYEQRIIFVAFWLLLISWLPVTESTHNFHKHLQWSYGDVARPFITCGSHPCNFKYNRNRGTKDLRENVSVSVVPTLLFNANEANDDLTDLDTDEGN
jgi:hypothetical protein